MDQTNRYSVNPRPRRLLGWNTPTWNTRFTLTKALVLLGGGLLVYYIAVSAIMVDDLKTEGSLPRVNSPAQSPHNP